MQNVSLCVRRPSAQGQNDQHAVLVETPAQFDNLLPNHILIKVERFGFSTNNLTYEALGEQAHFRYFDFHAAPESEKTSTKTHGLIPVWGFGTITASAHPKITVGERVYGYFAPCRYLLVPVSPSDVNRHAFYVPRPHLPAGTNRRPYNQIIRCSFDPEYTPTELGENLTMLYRPLFWTAYWLEDWINSLNYRGASSVLISSASAKTAFCAAYLIRKRRERGEAGKTLKIVGLTSARNLPFTRGLGLYDEVVEYDNFETTTRGRASKWLYVDVAGNDSVNARLFTHFGSDGLAAAISVGMTSLAPASEKASALDWKLNTFSDKEALRDKKANNMENFFMVEWLHVRKNQLSVQEIFARQQKAWAELMEDCVPWVQLVRVSGAEAVKKVYDEVSKNGFSPKIGYVWSLWADEEQTSVGAKL
ncbi:hypothetical protein MKEN_00318900 [Mycena kentingensis (nom. inval.)]|nr:hypothetical protein MKEN_00318900 [Mycena kentingensis (nom. inval.)]